VLTAKAQVAGRLSGSVVDQSGAAVAGAAVNVYIPGGKEPVLVTKTNEAGLFVFTAVRPDKYDVAVEAPSFVRVLLRAVKVDPVQETGLPPVKLEVAATIQTLDVSGDIQTVQLANAEISTTITTAQLENIPLISRQVSALFASQAGVNNTTDTTSINGLRSSFSTVTLDGINIQDNFIRTNDLDYMPMRTTIDQVAEITITTTNANAAMGGGASQVVLSTRSGSNDFHGSFYWYNRNSKLSANDWFNNQSGVAKPFLDLNQPGASLGGRILRDKLFFYVNYELYRNKQQASTLRTVLTDSARAGTFQYRDTGNVLHSVNLQSLRNFTVNPAAKALIDQLPPPNNSSRGDGLNTAGYRFNARSNEFRDQFIYKGDYYISPKHGLSGTYNYISNPTDRPDQGAFYTTVPPVSNTIKNHLLGLSWRWTASSTLTNELRGGFARANASFLDSNEYPKSIVAGLLFSNPVNTFLNQGRQTNTYHIQDNANWIRGKHRVAFGFQSLHLRITPFIDSGILPTYTLGISSANTTGLTAADLPGIRSTDITTANSLYTNLAGILTTAAQTFNVTSRTSGFVSGATNRRNLTLNTYAGYVQDTWKFRPGLTFSIGLRYEYWTPLDETDGLFLAPRLENNNIVSTLLNRNAVLDFIGGPTGSKFYKSDGNNLAPNFGLAWDPFGSGKTSVRAGYMIAYVNDNVVTAVRNNVNTSSGLASSNNLINLTGTLANAPTVPTPAYKVPRTLADNYALDTQSATGRPDPNLATPYVQQWNIGIQHEIKGTIFEARYVGNHGTKLIRAFDYNQVLYNAGGFLADFLRAQSNAEKSLAATGSYNGSFNAAIPGSQPLTVFPLLASGGLLTNATIQNLLRQGQVGELANTYQINGLNGPINFYINPNILGANTVANTGNSTYHALQIEARRRTRGGLQAQFNYAFGKALSNAAGDAQTNFEPFLDNNNPSLERARSPLDLTHSFKANVYYELPYGPGKTWHGNRILNGIFGSWALASSWGYQSGSPYSILSAIGTLNRSARSSTTNTASVYGTNGETLKELTTGVFMTGTGPYFLSPKLLGPDGRGAATFGAPPFPGQVFFNPTAGNVGNLQRRMFTGPWDWVWDLAVKKSFVFRERHRLDFHFDFANFMNHPTFYTYPQFGDNGSTTNYVINNTAFGKITDMNHSPRIIQIGAYYRF